MIIEKSEQVGELFKALSKAQKEIENPIKDKSGYNDRYKYAKLEQYIELSKDVLEKYGLSIIQFPGEINLIDVSIVDDKGNKHVESLPKQKIMTMIVHESGQYIGSAMDIIVEKTKQNSWGQSSGVAISFARRYSWAGSLGMAAEDDDNQLPQKKKEKEQERLNAPSRQLLVNEEQVKDLRALINADVPTINYIKNTYKIQRLEDLSVDKYVEVRDLIRSLGGTKINVPNVESKVA